MERSTNTEHGDRKAVSWTDERKTKGTETSRELKIKSRRRRRSKRKARGR